jgi:glycerol-3-phosphate acyltransferase PlsX
MQKNQDCLQSALIVKSHASRTACARSVVFMTGQPLFTQKKTKILPAVGLDLMGSDEDSSFVLDSLIPILKSLEHSAHFILFGEEKNEEALKSIPSISYQISSDIVQMDENPLLAVRKKKGSSLHLGMRALKNKEIGAFISMGNTGALMATARLHLDTLPNISRPALLTLLPTKKKEMVLLDVGANTNCKGSHLVEFAAMGIAYQKARGIKEPGVGLLNIGREAIKGPPELQKAYKMLSKSYPFFHGNVEGRDAFEGLVDVLVTDGFTGNIFLKTSEGIAGFLLDKLSAYSQLKELRSRLDYSEYPGALLAGVNGLVIKCHGTAKSASFHHSLTSALYLLEHNFLDTLSQELLSLFSKEH